MASDLWYRNATIYEVYLRSFADGNGDGIGDIPGLTERLDYLADLGIDCIWLLPFYPSPLRDDGYDVADYCAVHPDYGTLEDFEELLQRAHARGMRVLIDLVLNHTSDQHPWFQQGRSPDSPYHDYYVWSEDPGRFPEARIIFLDIEPSNWSWDDKAGKYFWHRFYAFQPDLNFDNPAVQAEILNVVKFWCERGVDGFRLDAVPYLFERPGTSCENLTETHAFLRRMRSYIDAHFPGRVLLAEANQRPHDLVPYFGGGDELHLAFHFPLMPRIFEALRREDRAPIVRVLESYAPDPGRLQLVYVLAKPRRAHARDARSGGKNLDVARVRARAPHAHEPGHPPSSGSPAGGRSTAPASLPMPCSSPCQACRFFTTEMKSAWGTTSGSRTGAACAPPCNGTQATWPGFRPWTTRRPP